MQRDGTHLGAAQGDEMRQTACGHGNILGQGYLAGFGMTIGTVFGRLAGAEAAKQARN